MFQGYIKGILFITLVASLAWLAYALRPSLFQTAPQAPVQIANEPLDTSALFQEGKHYQKLPAKITSNRAVQEFINEDPGKIQAIEFFSYACYWCSRLHPYVNDWVSKKPENLVFYRFPVVFNKGWDVLAKAFYIVQNLNQSETLDETFFKALHKDNIEFLNEKQLQDFFVKQGIAQNTASELYHSFEINRAVTRGNEIISAFQITISPSVVLNLPSGSYFVTLSMAGNEQNFIEILNYLIEREKENHAAKNDSL